MKDLENIIEEVDGSGKFQKTLLYSILTPLYLFLPLSWCCDVFILQLPDHWCHHPSTVSLNNSELLRWKECYLPKKEDGSFEGCKILTTNQPDFWIQEKK